MATEDDELAELVLRFAKPRLQTELIRAQERTALLERGEALVLPLIAELQKAKKQGEFLQARRVAELLAEFGDPRAVPSLLDFFFWDVGPVRVEPLRTTVPRLAQRQDAASRDALIMLFKEVRFSHSELAVFVAKALVHMAEQNPTQELAVLLPLMHSGFLAPSAPLEFGPLRRRLKAALKLMNLPLPASSPSAIESLPLPAEKEVHE